MRMMLIAALLSGASPAIAQCRDDLVTVTKWDAALIEPAPSLRMTIVMSVQISGDRPVRMIDGLITFRDVLGNRIASMQMEPDKMLTPGEDHLYSSQWGANTFERLLDLEPADVTVETCVNGLVYADGEVAKFVP